MQSSLLARGSRADGEKRNWLAAGIAMLASFMLVSFLVVGTSRAVFSDTTDNSGNSLTAGSVTLTDDDLGAVLFNVTMLPGDTVQECITVTYSGTATDPSAVKMYSGGYTDSGNFGDHLDLVVEEGTGGSFGDCSGFNQENVIEPLGGLVAWDSTHTDYATGAGVWDPTGTPESKTYRITVTLDNATPNAQQGESVTALSFIWEVQS